MGFLILVPLIIVVILASLLILVASIPARISLAFDQAAGKTTAEVTFTWSIFSVLVTSSEASGVAQLRFAGKPVIQRPFSSQIQATGRKTVLPAIDIRNMILFARLIKAVSPGIFRIVRVLRRNLELGYLQCDLIVGTGSPASTGFLFGMFSALRPLVMLSDRVSLTMTPIFDREAFGGSCRLDLRVVKPVILLALIIRIFLSRDVLAIFREYRDFKKEAAA